jgi:hypothetical protein
MKREHAVAMPYNVGMPTKPIRSVVALSITPAFVIIYGCNGGSSNSGGTGGEIGIGTGGVTVAAGTGGGGAGASNLGSGGGAGAGGDTC